MIIAIIALVLHLVNMLPNYSAFTVTFISGPTVNDLTNEYDRGCECDECYWTESYIHHLIAFDELFDSYSTKRARNGAMMISRDGKNYRFAKKG